jgi:hypothetical protein
MALRWEQEPRYGWWHGYDGDRHVASVTTECAAPALQVNAQHNLDPTARFPSVCLVDGDSRDRVNPDDDVYALPGDRAPEAHIFDQVLDELDVLAAKLTVAMQLTTDQQERVKDVVRERAVGNRDRHVIYQQIGEQLDFTSGFIVAQAFLTFGRNSTRRKLRS